MLVGGFAVRMQRQAADSAIQQANALWDAGKHADAIDRYRGIVEEYGTILSKSEQSMSFRRVIDFDAEAGNEAAAKKLIERAVNNGVTLSLESAKGVALMDEVLEPIRKKEALELKKTQVASRADAWKKVEAAVIHKEGGRINVQRVETGNYMRLSEAIAIMGSMDHSDPKGVSTFAGWDAADGSVYSALFANGNLIFTSKCSSVERFHKASKAAWEALEESHR